MSESNAMTRWEVTLHRAIGISIAILLGFWAADRADPSPTKSVSVLNPMLSAGDDLQVRYRIERKRECAVRLYRTFIDSQGVRWELEEIGLGSAGPVGPDTFTRNITVPEKIAPGGAKLRAVAVYQCNPLHSVWPIVIRLPDESFEVAAR